MSVAVVGFGAIKLALGAVQMEGGGFGIAVAHLLAGGFGYLGLNGDDRPSSRHGKQLHLAGAFQIVEVIPRLGNRFAHSHDAVMFHENDVGAPYGRSDTFAFDPVALIVADQQGGAETSQKALA